MKNWSLFLKLLCIYFFFVSKTLFAQNQTVIDAIQGVGEFKWGMSLEQINCTEDENGWCNFYPGNFYLNTFKVYQIKIAVNQSDFNTYIKGVFWIELYLSSNKLEDFNKCVKELKTKYGTPTKSEDDFFTWSGKNVTVSIRYLFEDGQNKTVIWYIKKPTKTTVGF
jgi:hypothetical protein